MRGERPSWIGFTGGEETVPRRNKDPCSVLGWKAEHRRPFKVLALATENGNRRSVSRRPGINPKTRFRAPRTVGVIPIPIRVAVWRIARNWAQTIRHADDMHIH